MFAAAARNFQHRAARGQNGAQDLEYGRAIAGWCGRVETRVVHLRIGAKAAIGAYPC
jgi:hypothetical protein